MEDADFNDFFEDGFEEETEEIIEYLVSQGAAEWDGMDEFGERMFKFNMDTLKEIMPELYRQIMLDVDNTMLSLFNDGLVDIEYNENLEAMFKVSDKARAILEDLGIDYLINNDPDLE
jgi:hypothetical protein